jgi:CheY-like chemotaxis protein
MESKHVLVVDDDSMIRNCIAEILSQEGYEVYCAIHGKDALDQLVSMREDQLPGCIILDLKMPVMDGMTFLQSIQQEYADSLGQIPVIVSSANGNLKSLPNLDSAVERWDKPLDLDNLFRVAYKYCGSPSGEYLH